MKRTKRNIALALLLIAAMVASGLGLVACQQQDGALESKIRYGLNTKEDVVLHSGADLVVYSDDHSTVKFQVDGSTGAIDSESSLDMTSLNVVAPTTIATATPVALINSTGVSALLELRKASTPVFQVNGSGNVDAEGSLDIATGAIIAAPTTQATAVPALKVDSAGVSALIEAQKNATRVFQVAGSGNTYVKGNLSVDGWITDSAGPLEITDADGIYFLNEVYFGASISNDGYGVEIYDSVLINGENDDLQLLVSGDSGQTEPIFKVDGDSGNLFAVNNSPAGNAGAKNLVEVLGWNPINTTGTNTLNALLVDLDVGNSSGGTNALRGVQIDGISDDDEVTSTALNIGSGWDTAISAEGPVTIVGSSDATELLVKATAEQMYPVVSFAASNGAEILTARQPLLADAGNTVALVTVEGASATNTDNTNTLTGLLVDLNSTEHTGGTNYLNGVKIDSIGSGEELTTETALTIGTGWDVGIANSGSSNLKGDVYDSGGDLTLADDVVITGTLELSANVEHIGLPSIISVPITYTAAAGGSGTVATVGAGEVWLVHEVWVKVTTNFDATGDDATLIVGDSNDTDGFLSLNDAALQAAYSAGTGWEAGYYGLKDGEQGAYVADGSMFVYDGAETIDWAVDEVDGETLSAGSAIVYVRYTRIQ